MTEILERFESEKLWCRLCVHLKFFAKLYETISKYMGSTRKNSRLFPTDFQIDKFIRQEILVEYQCKIYEIIYVRTR